MDTPTITDGVIVLDALRPADAAAFAAMDDEEIRRAFGAVDHGAPMSAEGAALLIKEWATAWSEDGQDRAFAVRRDGALVGVVLARLKLGGWLATLDLRIAAAARRQHLGTRALRLLADYAVGDLGVSRLRLDVYEWNEPAQRLALSLGFKQLDNPAFGQPGWIYFGVTDGEWTERSRGLVDDLGEGWIA